MLVTADWVLPISRRPIRDGGVLIDGDRIAEVGPVAELSGSPLADPRVDLPGCVLMPGLVNAHTHLALSALVGLVEPAPFVSWLRQLVPATRTMSADDRRVSAALGVTECLLSGVTVVGDIAYGPESADVANEAGLGGTFFWEILGVPGPALWAEMERLELPLDCTARYGRRIRCGLSPHSPYTSGPDLFRTVRKAAAEAHMPVAIHVAESAAEVELTRDGTGSLAGVAERVIGGFEPVGADPVEYLDRLGALDGATVIHLGELAPGDAPRLASTVRGAVTCPRSNHYLHNRVAPVAKLQAAGIPVGIGTDSTASNSDLDLFEDIRALRAEEPGLSARELLAMATVAGATAIGLEDRFGLIEPGMQADLAAFRVGATADPEVDVVSLGGASTLDSVMTGGVWRVRDRQLLADRSELLREAETIAARALEALQG